MKKHPLLYGEVNWKVASSAGLYLLHSTRMCWYGFHHKSFSTLFYHPSSASSNCDHFECRLKYYDGRVPSLDDVVLQKITSINTIGEIDWNWPYQHDTYVPVKSCIIYSFSWNSARPPLAHLPYHIAIFDHVVFVKRFRSSHGVLEVGLEGLVEDAIWATVRAAMRIRHILNLHQ